MISVPVLKKRPHNEMKKIIEENVSPVNKKQKVDTPIKPVVFDMSIIEQLGIKVPIPRKITP